MKINVFGYGKGDFTDQKTGERVEGKKIYYGYKDPSRQDLVGMATGYLFVSAKKAQAIDFDALLKSQICEASFNQFGNLTSIEPCLLSSSFEDELLEEAI